MILLTPLSLRFEDGNLKHTPRSQAMGKGGMWLLCIVLIFPEQMYSPVFQDSTYVGWRLLVEVGDRGGGIRAVLLKWHLSVSREEVAS